jgi:hypothetical protein
MGLECKMDTGVFQWKGERNGEVCWGVTYVWMEIEFKNPPNTVSKGREEG